MLTEPAAVRSSEVLRGWVRRRPVTAFLIWVFGLGWPIGAVPALVEHGWLVGPQVPLPLVVLVITYGVMLPAALTVTAVTDGRVGVSRLLARAVAWRLAPGRPGWRRWPVIALGVPAVTLLLGVAAGGTLTLDGRRLGADLISVASALLLIHLAEETVWAGFVQTRLSGGRSVFTAAALTAVPFTAIHLPLTLLGPVTLRSLLTDAGGLLVLGLVLRLLIGASLRWVAGSVLAAAVLHTGFNAASNSNGPIDHLLSGVDQGLLAPAAAILLTAALLVAGLLSPAGNPQTGKPVSQKDRPCLASSSSPPSRSAPPC